MGRTWACQLKAQLKSPLRWEEKTSAVPFVVLSSRKWNSSLRNLGEDQAMERLSKTGLVIPDRVPWGTHLCQFYETKDDLLEVLVPYFKEGLAANESCIWITSDPMSVEEAKIALRAAVPELEHYLMTGQMEIIPHDEWYLLGGSFKIDAVLAAWCKKAEIALDQRLLRVAGNG